MKYQEGLVSNVKACENKASQLRESFKEQLLEKLPACYLNVIDDLNSSGKIKDK